MKSRIKQVEGSISVVSPGRVWCLTWMLMVFPLFISAQEEMHRLSVHGYLSGRSGFYSARGTGLSSEAGAAFRSNSYAGLVFNYRKLSAGVRYEAYLPPLPGFDYRYKGQGLSHIFGNYSTSGFSLTLGSFYEQFGSGLIFRSYENQHLGVDNSMAGARVTLMPFRGVMLKSFIGRQRDCWTLGEGVVKGLDGEWNVPESFRLASETRIIAGLSMVSRYQKDSDPLYNLPENVAAFSGRLSFSRSGFQLSGEYGYKINDPSALNNMIFKHGQALILDGSYADKGIGILLSGKWTDNMDFRTERGASGNALTLGFMPAAFKEHTYALAAMYPYISQPLGEAAIRSEINLGVPKGTFWGGPFGTNVLLQAGLAQSIRKKPVDTAFPVGMAGTKGYHSSFLAPGDEKYFSDLTLEVSRKFSRTFRMVAGYTGIYYNISVLQGHPGEPDVKATTLFADLTFRLSARQSFRTELQHLQTKQDKGAWSMALFEYTPSPRWVITLSDQYNYGNDHAEDRKHYPLLDIAFNLAAHRLNLTAGKQREGVVCIGGICRYVPASSGFGLTYTLTY